VLYAVAIVIVKYEVILDTFGNHKRELCECFLRFIDIHKNILEFAVAQCCYKITSIYIAIAITRRVIRVALDIMIKSQIDIPLIIEGL
jgi:hypothetical protein